MKIGSNPSVQSSQALFDILQANQDKSLDLAKKLVRISAGDRQMQNEAEQKGQIIDMMV